MRQATANGSIRAGGFTYLCLIQGVYYLLTGLWPLVSIETFQMVTGPKTDHLVTGRESDYRAHRGLDCCSGPTRLPASSHRRSA